MQASSSFATQYLQNTFSFLPPKILLLVPVIFNMGVKRKFDQSATDAPCGGVLTLTGLEHMSKHEKTTRIQAVVNDMTASFIYIGDHVQLGTITADQTTPLYNLVEDITATERGEWKRLEKKLERCEKKLEAAEKKHTQDMEDLARAATAEIKCLSRKIKRNGPGTGSGSVSSRKVTISQLMTESGVESPDDTSRLQYEDNTAGDKAADENSTDDRPTEALDEPIRDDKPIDKDQAVEDRTNEELPDKDQQKPDGPSQDVARDKPTHDKLHDNERPEKSVNNGANEDEGLGDDDASEDAKEDEGEGSVDDAATEDAEEDQNEECERMDIDTVSD